MVSSDKLQLVKPTLSLKNEALNYRQEHFDYERQVGKMNQAKWGTQAGIEAKNYDLHYEIGRASCRERV